MIVLYRAQCLENQNSILMVNVNLLYLIVAV